MRVMLEMQTFVTFMEQKTNSALQEYYKRYKHQQGFDIYNALYSIHTCAEFAKCFV